MNKKRGFTLAEMLIVVTIITTLVLLSLGYLIGATKRGRDAKRRADLEQIRSALEMYRAEHMIDGYPLTLEELKGPPTAPTVYLRTIPPDPLKNSNREYRYQYVSATSYRIGALLENDNPDPAATGCDPAWNIYCIMPSTLCNYCLLNP